MKAAALLLALTASLPATAAEPHIFEQGSEFVAICGAAGEIQHPTDEELAVLAVCGAFVTGVAQTMVSLDDAKMGGEPICSRPTTPRVVIDRMVSLYSRAPELAGIGTTELVLRSFRDATPCPR